MTDFAMSVIVNMEDRISAYHEGGDIHLSAKVLKIVVQGSIL